jgi:ribokinase
VSAGGWAAALRGVRVLVIGGINVDDHLIADAEPPADGCEVVRRHARGPGGHAGNCAAALAALGVRAAVIGAVGRDAEGREALDDLRRAGVDTGSVLVSDALPTGRVFIPDLGGRRYMLMARGANDDPALASRVAEVAGDGWDAIVLFDPPPAAAAALAAAHADARICWSPGGLLVKEPGFAERVGFCDALIVNEVEMELAFAGTPPEGRFARAFGARAGARLVVTHGARGAELVTGAGARWFDAHLVHAVDATGAGDAFTAAWVAMDALGAPADACMRAANVAGALATRAVGSRASLASAAALATALASHGHEAPALAARGSNPAGGWRR